MPPRRAAPRTATLPLVSGTLRVTGRDLERHARRNLAQALNLWLRNVLADAQLIVPLDEGPLSESGHVIEATPDRLRGQVRFSKPYAARQHEELDWNHLPGRQAKYLEVPFKRRIPELRPLTQTVLRRTRELLR